MTLDELARDTARRFAGVFGRAPRWIASAPGRVNVIGEHTDYNLGLVLPMAIDRHTVIAAAPAAGRTIRFHTTLGDRSAAIDLGLPLAPLAAGNWANYPVGVLAGFISRGVAPGGFDALVHSDIPAGSGLSSSAALEVATATLLEAITGEALDPIAKALLCQEAENRFAGVPCGLMDPCVCVMAEQDHLLLLDCRSRQTQLVPVTGPAVAFLVVDTNVERELVNGAYASRRAECEGAARILGVPSLREVSAGALEEGKGRMDAAVFRRARHVVTEIGRTTRAAEAFRASDWTGAGRLMTESHISLRADFEVSCPELDAAVGALDAIGREGGVFGSRMTGGGFGGCVVALVSSGAAAGVSREIAERYETKTGIRPSAFVSRPARGAAILQA